MSFMYIHAKPDATPFYVGKGTFARTKSFASRNNFYKNVVNKYGIKNILVGRIECSSDKIAFELEIGVIKCLRRSGIDLTNMSDGGEGFCAGNIPWNKGAKMSSTPWNKGAKMSDAVRERLSEITKQIMTNPRRRDINRQAMTGNRNRRGKKHTRAAIEKMVASKTGVPSKRKGIAMDRDVYEKSLAGWQVKWECPVCGKIGMGKGAANRWHFDNCKGKRESNDND